MKPQDHSDTTLLVWADWLEENGEEQKAHELQEEIATPPVKEKRWNLEYRRYGFSGVGGGIREGDFGVGNVVGGARVGDHVGGGGGYVGGGLGTHVGGGDMVGGSDMVGGE